jgi:ribonucleoside-diphosphate reductase beta chain
MVSFATSLAMVENKIFIGNGNIIQLILQDEITAQGMDCIWIDQSSGQRRSTFCCKPRLECEAEVYQLYLDVIREEKEWADYLFKHGPVIGLNANILTRLCGLHCQERTQRNWHQVPRTCTKVNTYSLVQQARGYQQETNCTAGERKH